MTTLVFFFNQQQVFSNEMENWVPFIPSKLRFKVQRSLSSSFSQTCLQRSALFLWGGGGGGGQLSIKILHKKNRRKKSWKGRRGKKIHALNIYSWSLYHRHVLEKGIPIFLILYRCSCLRLSTYRFLKFRRVWVLWASLQELWIESFRILIICFIVSRAFSIWKLSGCPASVYFESCCEK